MASVKHEKPIVSIEPVKEEPVLRESGEKESDVLLTEMFTILDKSINFSEHSQFSVLRKKYKELKGQGK